MPVSIALGPLGCDVACGSAAEYGSSEIPLITHVRCLLPQVNALNHEMGPEMENILDKVENDPSIRAAVLISGKPGNFIAGADIKMLVRAAHPARPPGLTHTHPYPPRTPTERLRDRS